MSCHVSIIVLKNDVKQCRDLMALALRCTALYINVLYKYQRRGHKLGQSAPGVHDKSHRCTLQGRHKVSVRFVTDRINTETRAL